MKYKTVGFLLVTLLAMVASASCGFALSGSRSNPVIETTVAYDPVTLQANLVNMTGIEELELYFRYRKEGAEKWKETRRKTMTSKGEYSQVLEDIDPDTKYEFEVVAEWEEGEVATFETEPEPAKFEFYNLRVEPEEAYINETVEMKIDAKNVGGRAGEETVNFAVDGEIVASKTAEAEAGEKTTVSAEYVPEEKGSYEVGAANGTASFEVYSLPSVEGREAANVTHDSAVLVGEVTNIGLEKSVDAYFKYRPAGENWKETSRQSLESEGEFSERVEDLDPEATYEFRAVVEWDDRRAMEEELALESKPVTVKPKALAGGDMKGVADIGVFLWGEGKSLDSEIVEYRWDFDDDGTWDYNSSETGRTLHTYREAGIYNATLQVEDEEGERSVDTTEVEVRERKQPLYEIEEKVNEAGGEVYFDTQYLYREEENRTNMALNMENTAEGPRHVSVAIDLPKEIASSFKDVETFPRPVEVLEENSKAVWNFTLGGGETARIEISLEGHTETERFDGMKITTTYETGKGVKTRTITGLITRVVTSRWSILTVIVIVALFLIFFGDRAEEVAGKVSRVSKGALRLGDEESENGGVKELLDQKFINTAREAKEALKRKRVTNPKRLLQNLERANEALEEGKIGRFLQHLDQVENEMNYGTFSRNTFSQIS